MINIAQDADAVSPTHFSITPIFQYSFNFTFLFSI